MATFYGILIQLRLAILGITPCGSRVEIASCSLIGVVNSHIIGNKYVSKLTWPVGIEEN